MMAPGKALMGIALLNPGVLGINFSGRGGYCLRVINQAITSCHTKRRKQYGKNYS